LKAGTQHVGKRWQFTRAAREFVIPAQAGIQRSQPRHART
jgi:hypothetical protein